MNRTLPSLPTRSSVLRRASFGFLVVCGLGVSSLRADEPVPPAKPAPTGPVLNLLDGGYVAGSLEDSGEAGVVRWQSTLFARPLEFPIDGVQSIRFPAIEKLPRPTGSFGFELTGGDILYGSIVSLDDKRVELDVARIGKIDLDRSRLRRIFRWRDGADLVYNGPNGLTGWKEIAPVKAQPPQNGVVARRVVQNPPARKPASAPQPKWTEEGGPLFTNKTLATIQANVDLPVRSSIELDLSWKTKPDFMLALGVSDAEETVARAFRLEVWDGQVVAVRSTATRADVVSLLTVPDGPGRLQLQIFLDQEQGKLLVFSAGGEALATMQLGGQTGAPLPGVRLTNVKGDIRLERLRIGRWDGETPRPIDPNLARVQLTDQSSVRGQVEDFDPETREFVVKGDSGETRIAEDKVSNVFLVQPIENPIRSIRAVYQDGTRISGEWSKVEGGSLLLDSPGVAGSIRLPMSGLRSLDVSRPDAKPRDQLDPTGTLEADGLRLLGRLVDTGGQPGESALAWKPIATDASSPIRPGVSARINYKRSPHLPKVEPKAVPVPQAPAAPRRRNLVGALLEAFAPADEIEQPANPVQAKAPDRKMLYLRTGDIIPAEVLKIDENGVTFRTPLSISSFVPNDRIKAVEIASDNPNAMKLTKAKFERLLTLPRMQRESPPTHLIRCKNGDMLRARITSMDDKTIRLEVRLEDKELPRDRVSRIIWLHADETDPAKKPKVAPEVASTERVQVVRSDGIRLTFRPERFADETLNGKSDILGDCKVRMTEVDQLLIGGQVEKEAVQVAYQTWKLQNAPDPKSAQDDEGSTGGGGAAGTESSLVGKPAPDFELDLMGGKKFHLADHKGKVVVLDFWATWCGPCLQVMPQIDKVTHEFADQGVELIAVNLQESPEKIKALLERIKLSPTVALDRDGVVAQKYAANAIPQTVIIDREGKITRLFIGGGPKFGDQLREALKAVTSAEKP